MITLSAGEATATLDAENGGRIVSLRVGGVELLVTEGESEIRWGVFPMVPFAGRIANGRFSFDGADYTLPPRLDGHAIHGTALDQAWSGVGPTTVAVEIGQPWPFPATVEHTVDLTPDHLTATLRFRAGARQPVTLGWHPWFRRELERGSAVNLGLVANLMYERKGKLPTGELVEPKPPPWDDCFTGVEWPVMLRWPGFGSLEVISDCSHVVVYDEERDAVCVEPQIGPPDAVNIGGAAVREAGEELVATMRLSWVLEG